MPTEENPDIERTCEIRYIDGTAIVVDYNKTTGAVTIGFDYLVLQNETSGSAEYPLESMAWITLIEGLTKAEKMRSEFDGG